MPSDLLGVLRIHSFESASILQAQCHATEVFYSPAFESVLTSRFGARRVVRLNTSELYRAARYKTCTNITVCLHPDSQCEEENGAEQNGIFF